MKHLIETEALSGLPTTEYDRIILESATDNVIVRDGINTEYVDFGLPSRLKWAKCNVGAKKETDCGYYFQWGDIVDKSNSDCSWENYKYCNGSYDTLTKYCTNTQEGSFGTVDNKTTLEPMDDAARVYMGSEWRMPTVTDFQELLDHTTNAWVENFDESGVSGRKFTSTTDTSKYIFIPASFERSVFSTYMSVMYSIWSSSLDPSFPSYAGALCFDSNAISGDGNSRSYGLPVRGVCE